jgi:hypothetical protein
MQDGEWTDLTTAEGPLIGAFAISGKAGISGDHPHSRDLLPCWLCSSEAGRFETQTCLSVDRNGNPQEGRWN